MLRIQADRQPAGCLPDSEKMPSDEREQRKIHNQEYTISSLIKKEFILVEKEVMSKEEILKKGCDLLYKK